VNCLRRVFVIVAVAMSSCKGIERIRKIENIVHSKDVSIRFAALPRDLHLLITRSSPLHEACKEGSLERVQWRLREGICANVQDLFGRTPLGIACENGHLDIVMELLEHGALINRSEERLC
jgi:ankyrin repeat protein